MGSAGYYKCFVESFARLGASLQRPLDLEELFNDWLDAGDNNDLWTSRNLLLRRTASKRRKFGITAQTRQAGLAKSVVG